MNAFFLFAVLATLPPDATTVRLDADRWVLRGDEKRPAESIWWWTAECAPQKIAAGARATCVAPRPLRVAAVRDERRPLPAARVVWGTEEMLADLPDEHLPRGIASDAGETTIAVPPGSPVWIRVDGPQFATHWRRVAAGERGTRLIAQPATTVRIRPQGLNRKSVSRARIALVPSWCQDEICAERLLTTAGEDDSPSSITVITGTTYRVVAWSDSHGPVTRMATIDRPEDILVDFPAGTTLSGRVIDGDDQAVSAALLTVQYRLPDLRQTVKRVAMATADGVLRLSGLPPGPVEWSVAAAGYSRRVAEVALSPEPPLDLGDIVLTKSRSASVRVLDHRGRPVKDARVVMRGAASGRTDAEGIIRFTELPGAAIDLEVSAEGFLLRRVILPGDDEELTVELDRGSVIKARLLREADGTAPQDVRVRLTNAGGSSLRTVGSSSELVVAALTPGPTRIVVTAEGVQPFDSGTLTLGEGETVDLGMVVLKSGFILRGAVVDENSAPLPGAKIRALRLAGDAPPLAHVLGNWASTTSRDDGSFVLTGLVPGAQLIAVAAPGYAERVLSDAVLAAETPEVDLGSIKLRRGKELDVTCRPAKRCGTEAAVLLAGADFPFLAIRGPLSEGRGTLHAVPSGEVLLRLTRAHQVIYEKAITVREDGPRARAEIVLPSVRVSGTVTVGGRRARGGSLRFERSIHTTGRPIVVRQKTAQGSTIGSEVLGSFGLSSTAAVDDSGSFVIDELEAGKYEVTFRKEGSATAVTRVTISEVAQQSIALSFEGREIAGVVLDRRERPVPASLEVVDALGVRHKTQSGLDGRFALLGIAPGRANVTATATAGRGEVAVDTTAESARTTVVRLTSERSALTVLVNEADGKPARGVLVFASTLDGIRMASTDGDGRVEFAQLSDGHVQMAAHRPGGVWAFGDGRSTESVRLVLPPFGGAMLARGGAGGAVSVIAPNGFRLDAVLAMVGIATHLSAGATLRIDGLPPGSYAVTRGLLQKHVSVTPGKTAVADFAD